MKIKVILVEDNPSLRKRFAEQLSFYNDIELVDSYSCGEAAIKGIRLLPPDKFPDVILMDIGLPKISGIETTALLKEDYPDLEIMMLTVFEDETKIFQAIQSGASGYLLKDEPFEIILDAIHELHNGGAPISQSIARKVMSLIKSNHEENKDNSSMRPELVLSKREFELLNGLANGGSYTSIANDLFISPHTVKTHIKNIYKKLHVHTRAAAVRAWLGKL